MGKAQKEDLICVASELNVEIVENPIKTTLKQVVMDKKYFDKEFMKNLLNTIIKEQAK